ncbi:MAG: peptidoglycan editing factor PgeF [Archangium sp.]|nr:peptidoglycan editing factor PgeF [Archangium sp.]
MRTGGVSAAPYDSLNSSFAVGDEVAAVTENLARLAARAGVGPARLLFVKQVHGARVVEAVKAAPDTEADALWTDVPGTAVGVRTADCLPILIEDPRGRVAAVHAGWRGVISEIVARTVEQLVERGGRPAELKVAIGPCIQRCCFEVDGELPGRFEAAFGAGVIHHPAGKAKVHLDLPRAVQQTLTRLGVPEGHVVALPHCTMCDGRFFSHRREHGITGRHLSFITCAP